MKMEQVYGELELAKAENEKLKFTLNEKESIIKHLSTANIKLRSDSDEKLRKLEEENSRLLKGLDEEEEKNKGQDRAIGVLKSEVENIKAILCAAQKKCLEAEQEAKALRDGNQKEDELVRLEDGKRKVEDQLKWKKEQFDLLKQAHEKLKGQFESSKREWELEKSSLLDEISSMQATLDCQNSKAESLKTQLDMCKQALAHEDNRRQNLESRVSEMNSRLECVSDECWEAKSRVYSSSVQRDDQISALRDSLREKESELKDTEYKARKLEKENQDLLNSLRELQEAHIPKATSLTPPSSMAKIKSKLKALEQTHKACSATLRSKEAEWSSQMEKMRRDLEDHKFCLKIKEASIQDLKRDLEECNATDTELKLQNEELSLMLQLLRTEFSETQAKTRTVENAEDETDLNCKLNKASEIQKYKEMLDESYKEQASLKQELQEVCDAVERLEYELTEKVCQGSEVELELQIWKFNAERLRAQLEETQRMRRELEISLLAQSGFEEELKLEINKLKQQRGLLGYEDESSLQMEDDDKWPNPQEGENANQLVFDMGKAREVRASDERSPFREIN